MSPIPSIISPLVRHHQHARPAYTKESPLKGESDQSISSSSLFETPAKGKLKDDGTMSCSQELFGSPEMFTPAQCSRQSDQAMENQNSKNEISKTDGDDECVTDKSLTDSCKGELCSRDDLLEDELAPTCMLPRETPEVTSSNWEQPTPLLLKEFCGEPHLLPHSTPLSTVTQPLPTKCSLSHNTFPSSSAQPRFSIPSTPHNAPLHFSSQPRLSSQLSEDIDHTPEVPLVCAKEPSPVTHCKQPLDVECSKRSTVAEMAGYRTPSQEKKKKQLSQHNDYSLGGIGDVMDMLFMSSSQLDAHLSLHKATVESPSITAANESPPKSVVKENIEDVESILSSVPRSSSQFSDLECKSGEGELHKERVEVPAVIEETEHCLDKSNHVDVRTVTEAPLTSDNLDLENLTIKKLPLTKVHAFRYPSKARRNLKRKKSKTRTKEFSLYNNPDQSDKKTVAFACTADVDVRVEVEEPPMKRPRIHDVAPCDSNVDTIPEGGEGQPNDPKEAYDAVTTVEESVIEVDQTEEEKCPILERMDTETSETANPQERIALSSDNVDPPNNAIYKQPDGEGLILTEKGGISGLLPSDRPQNSFRAPGLRRTIKKPFVVMANTSGNEKSKEEYVSTMDPLAIKDQPFCSFSDSSSTMTLDSKVDIQPFLGFQTAAGGSITVSEQALKRAHQLLDEELHLQGSSSPNVLPEIVGSPKSTCAEHPAIATTTTPIAEMTAKFNGLDTTTPISSFVTPVPSRAECTPQTLSSSTTFSAQSCRRTATKQFKAPRKADEVSNVEEQASLSRILRSFRASGAATDPLAGKSTKSRIQRLSIKTGFQTAGGAKLTVSSEAMERAQKLVLEDKENGITADIGSSPHLNPSRTEERVLTGFKTTSGKGLSASSSSMARAAVITEQEATSPAHFKSPLSNCVHNDAVSVGFQMASGKSLSVSAKSLLEAESLLASDLGCLSNDPVQSDTCNNNVYDSMLTGFQTAGGRGISVSSKSMKSAKKLVEDEDKSSHPFDDIKKSLFQSPPCDHKEGKVDSGRLVTGFSTAKGSCISVSIASVQKCEKFIEIEQQMSLEFDKCATDDKVESGDSPNSPCSLTAEDVETFGAFTQIDFQKQDLKPPSENEKDVSKNDMSSCSVLNVSGTPIVSASCSNDLNLNKNRGLVEDEAEEAENEDHGCFFSTQVVKQLTDFSSEEETSSCGEEDDADTTIATQPKGSGASVKMDTAGSEKTGVSGIMAISNNEIESYGCDDEKLVVKANKNCRELQEQPHGLEHESSSLPGDRQNVFAVQHCTNDVVGELSNESLPPAALLEADDHHHSTLDEASLAVNLSDVLTVSMIEKMDASINVSGIEPNDRDNQNKQSVSDEVNATKPCVSSTVSGDYQSNGVVSETVNLNDSIGAQSQPSQAQSSSVTCIPQFSGLQTASGKEVHISEEALMVAKQMLGTSDSTLHISPPPVQDVDKFVVDSLHTASGKPVHTSVLSPAAVNSDLDGRGNDHSQLEGQSRLPGLQTASGKNVEISESALHAVREVLGPVSGIHPSSSRGEGSNRVSYDYFQGNSGFCGLHTASGKEAKVSKNALLAVKEKLGSSSLDQSSDFSTVTCESPNPHPVGLMTAGGHRVEISDEALAAVRSTSATAYPKTGLQTASGKNIEICKESLRAAKLLLDTDPMTSTSSSGRSSAGSGFPGLFTAGGAKVTISQQALHAAKAALDGSTSTLTQIRGGTFQGLMTASGSEVTISEDSLQAARAVLDSCTPTSSDIRDKSVTTLIESPSLSAHRDNQNAVVPSTPQPTVSAGLHVPLATQPSSLPGAPNRKYRPIFKSGGTKSGRSQHFAFPGVQSVPMKSSVSRTPGAQQLPQSNTVAGLVSTPEGKNICSLYVVYILSMHNTLQQIKYTL